MSSSQRAYAQRNTNLTQIQPLYIGPMNNLNVSGAAVYVLDLSSVQTKHLAQATYYVDLSDLDVSGNPVDYSGVFRFDNSGNAINIINFGVNVPLDAAYNPGFEFTIFFKNPDVSRITQGIGPVPLLTLGLVALNGAPYPYTVSPPVPWMEAPPGTISQSITFKSDGTNYNVVSSGPAGWLGPIALTVLLRGTEVFQI